MSFKQGDFDLKGDEGRYWLWYHLYDTDRSGVFIENYTVVDYSLMVAFDHMEEKWDLRRYGASITEQ